MRIQPDEHDELHELIAESCEGTITPERFAKLTAMLRDNPEAQRQYLDHVRLDGGLRWEYGAARRTTLPAATAQVAIVEPADDETDGPIPIATAARRREPVAPRPAGRASRTLWAAYAVAAALVIGGVAIAVVLVVASSGTPQQPQQQPDAPRRVATLTDAQNVAWVSDLLNPGDEIAAGTIATESGDAEFVFASGAQVSISGRVQMHIDSAMRVSMEVGRATFICPPDAVGFTVMLPDGVRVVDLGTEFTIDQRADGASIRVIQGRVQVHGQDAEGKPTRRMLSAGQAAGVMSGRLDPRPDIAVNLPADTAATDASGVPIPPTVPVGDPENPTDSTGFGRVSYAYRIGKYEVTNEQYAAFLNAKATDDPRGLYNPQMADEYGGIVRLGSPGAYRYTIKDGFSDKPVNFVSWLDAVRYTNWLSNGRSDGDTETGPYVIRGDQVTLPDHAQLAGREGVTWVLPTEDEWYKAAYFDPEKEGGAGYWRFATRSYKVGDANYNSNKVMGVGQFPPSAYGTHDQNGNMWEWNELVTSRGRGLRGGSFYLHDKPAYMHSVTRYDYIAPTEEQANYGFRVAALGRGTSR